MNAEITFEQNIIIGGGIESPNDFIKQQELAKILDREFLLNGVKNLKKELDKLIADYTKKYNVNIFIEGIDLETDVRFNVDLSN